MPSATRGSAPSSFSHSGRVLSSKGCTCHRRPPGYWLLPGAPRGLLTKAVPAATGLGGSLLLSCFPEVTTQGARGCTSGCSACVRYTCKHRALPLWSVLKGERRRALQCVSHTLRVDVCSAPVTLLTATDSPIVTAVHFAGPLLLDTRVSPAFHHQQMLLSHFCSFLSTALWLRETWRGMETKASHPSASTS